MVKRVLIAGTLGAAAMLVWMFVVNGLLGVRSRLDMKEVPAEREVHAVLAQHVTEPGRYVVNPVAGEPGMPPTGPVYGVTYSGLGHDQAGTEALLGLVGLVLPFLGAWLLAGASERVLGSYVRKVLFFSGIGLIVGIAARWGSYGIGGRTAGDAVALAVGDVLMWTAIGLVVAWRMRPERSRFA